MPPENTAGSVGQRLLRFWYGQRLGIAVGLILAATVWLLLRGTPSEPRTAGGSVSPVTAAAPAPPARQPPAQPATVQNPAEQVGSPAAAGLESQPQTPGGNASSDKPPTGIDQAAVQKALAQLAERGGSTSASSPAAASTPASPPGSDRYPGSQSLNVENAELPNIGIPVAQEVYTTSDSVSTVVSYYKQRYPEAEVTEINGQQIIAVNRPGATKVIAIGTNGQETRIAIVQPGN